MKQISKFIMIGVILALQYSILVGQVRSLSFQSNILDNSALDLVRNNVDTSDIPFIKSLVYSNDVYLSCEASLFLAERGYSDNISRIETRYDSLLISHPLEDYSLVILLKSICIIKPSDALQMVKAYIDTLKSSNIQPQAFQMNISAAIKLLAVMGDYSQFNILKSVVENDLQNKTNSLSHTDFTLLVAYGEKSEYRESVINLLKAYALDSRIDYRLKALYYLANFFSTSTEAYGAIKNIAQSDTNFSLRDQAISSIWYIFSDWSAISLYKNILLTSNDSTTIKEIATSLSDFESPYAYAALIESYNQRFQSQIATNIKEVIDNYWVPEPSEDIPISNLIDSLNAYSIECQALNWIGNSIFSTQVQNYLITAKTKLQTGDSLHCAVYVKQFQDAINAEYKDTLNQTTNFVTIDGWKFLYYNAQYILDRLPQSPHLTVALITSTGTKLTTGTLQYYEGVWKDATNYGDGTFSISTTKSTLSLRMTYEYGSQQKDNVAVGSDTVVFQTVNAQVKLFSSSGNPMDTGTVQYYAGAWRSFGVTTNGVAAKELLANNYSFRMTYAYGSNDKAQDLTTNPGVTFQTVNAQVKLINSAGNSIDQGIVQYYAGAWRTFGTTTNGVATKELLPNNYSFRMTYAYASNDKSQDLSSNANVTFQTVNTVVKLQDSQGNLLDTGTVQYYAGAWRSFGTTSGGVTTKELLANNYPFRMTHAYISNDKSQNTGSDNTVVFSTVSTTVKVTDNQSNAANNASVLYYAGAWRNFGATNTSGEVVKELLPANIPFRAKLGTAQKDVTQNTGTNALVEIQLP
jgi:hypothetical protein